MDQSKKPTRRVGHRSADACPERSRRVPVCPIASPNWYRTILWCVFSRLLMYTVTSGPVIGSNTRQAELRHPERSRGVTKYQYLLDWYRKGGPLPCRNRCGPDLQFPHPSREHRSTKYRCTINQKCIYRPNLTMYSYKLVTRGTQFACLKRR